ncbi:MAG: methyltransferase domain-containing protein [Methylococcales bacterium]|nr:methyltransferase domain-containing protein [Methylococcales bacterium]
MTNNMPYFDYLLAAFEKGHVSLEKSFGRHVHWGYWEQPELAVQTPDDYFQAAENLSRLVYGAAQLENGQSVLDVGCGFGGTLASVNECFQDMKLVGLNIDERQLARARQLVLPVGANTIQFQQGDACALPFADKSFDAVLAVECIFHFPSREVFLQEAYRVLKPGGYLALSDFVLSRGLSRLNNLFFAKHLSSGFFGKCNVDYTAERYRNLPESMKFSLELEKNINRNTQPTYKFLKALIKSAGKADLSRLELAGIASAIGGVELLVKWRSLEYYVFSYRKPLL